MNARTASLCAVSGIVLLALPVLYSLGPGPGRTTILSPCTHTDTQYLVTSMNRVYEDLALARYENAAVLLDDIILRYPFYSVAGVLRARLSLAEGDYGSVRTIIENVLETDSRNAEALHLLALVYEQDENYAVSLAILDLVSRRNEDFARIYLDRGRIYSRLGLFEEAYADVSRIEHMTRNEALLQVSRRLTALLEHGVFIERQN